MEIKILTVCSLNSAQNLVTLPYVEIFLPSLYKTLYSIDLHFTKIINRLVCCNCNFIRQCVCDNLFFPYTVHIMHLDLSTLTLLWRLPLRNFLIKLEVTFHVSNETLTQFCEYHKRKMSRPICPNISYSRLTTFTDTRKTSVTANYKKKGNLLSTFCIVSKMLLQLQ